MGVQDAQKSVPVQKAKLPSGEIESTQQQLRILNFLSEKANRCKQMQKEFT